MHFVVVEPDLISCYHIEQQHLTSAPVSGESVKLYRPNGLRKS